MIDNYASLFLARLEDTKQRYGIGLPVVDYERPELRDALRCDADALAKFLVEHHQAELNGFEVIVEDASAGRVTVLFAGTTRPPGRRFLEYRHVIVFHEDRQHYAFAIEKQECVLDRDDRVRINIPRWANR